MRAVGLLRTHRSLRRYVWWPILVNLVVGALLYALLLTAGLRAIDGVVAELDGLLAVLGILLQVLLVVVLLVAVGFVMVRFGVVLGSPWYGRLSEEIERLVTGTAPPAEPFTPRGIARDLRRALAFEARKLLLVVAIGLPLLLANLLPVVGQAIATVGGLALGATIACLDFYDGPLERRRWRFGDKLRFVRTTPGSTGFGLVCVALLSVPLLNLLCIPVCMAAGTLVAADRLRAQ